MPKSVVVLSGLAIFLAAPAAVVVAQDSYEPPPGKEQQEQATKAMHDTKICRSGPRARKPAAIGSRRV
ncbi:MAG TPA: hypothetical protein VHT03_12205 [Rhizomicrobium sp.]|jgi:hypothetical protein|nr:hypothetical protein [Rhizomicrobium sp.]